MTQHKNISLCILKSKDSRKAESKQKQKKKRKPSSISSQKKSKIAFNIVISLYTNEALSMRSLCRQDFTDKFYLTLSIEESDSISAELLLERYFFYLLRLAARLP